MILENYNFKGIPLENVRLEITKANFDPSTNTISFTAVFKIDGNPNILSEVSRSITVSGGDIPNIISIIESKIEESPEIVD